MIFPMKHAMIAFAVLALAACSSDPEVREHEIACFSGTVAGAMVGSAIGDQFGSGSGQDIARTTGATAGAIAGRSYACGE